MAESRHTRTTGGGTVFGECKYTGGQMDTSVFFRLQEKKNAVNWKIGLRNEHFVFFSISGYTEQMKGLAAERANVFLF